MRRKKSNEEKPPPFKGFTPLQRRTLAACWPARMSKAKREALDEFLAAAEQEIINVLNPPDWPNVEESTWSRKAARAELGTLYEHAHGLRIAIARIPEYERWRITAFAAASLPQYLQQRLHDKYLVMLADLAEILEDICCTDPRFGRHQPGPDVAIHGSVIYGLVHWHLKMIGRISASENGVFVRFLKTLGPMIGLSLGVDLLKTVLLDYQQE
jgi:hypothetical protein